MASQNSVVLVGDFNPAIFSPAWVRASQIFELDDGNDPQVGIIHQEVSDFTLADVRFYIDRTRFRIMSSVHEIGQVVKVALHALRDVLPHRNT